MRNALRNFPIRQAEHTGHAISRLLQVKGSAPKAAENQKDALNHIVDIGIPEVYTAAFERWKNCTVQHAEHAAAAEKQLCKEVPPERLTQCVSLSATTRGPLAIGLGNASPYEVGLSLHHTYGVPYLPGSALKGLTRRAALEQGMTEKDEAFRVLFGDTTSAGYVTFWDGWLDADVKTPLQLDTITVHHPQYYRNGGVWPTDFDDPNPVPFLSVRPGAKFHVALFGPGEWAVLAARLLEYGLTQLGLGGKTNAGYGGFNVEREKSEVELAAEAHCEEQRLEQERAAQAAKAFEGRAQLYQTRIDSLKPNNAASVVNDVISQTKEMPQHRELLQNLLVKLESDNRTKRDYKILEKVKIALEEEK